MLQVGEIASVDYVLKFGFHFEYEVVFILKNGHMGRNAPVHMDLDFISHYGNWNI